MNWKQMVGIVFCAFILWHKTYPPGTYTPTFEVKYPRPSFTWEPMSTYADLDGCHNKEQMDNERRKAAWKTLSVESKVTLPNVISVCFPETFDPREKDKMKMKGGKGGM